MKKTMSLILCALCLFMLCACGKDAETPSEITEAPAAENAEKTPAAEKPAKDKAEKPAKKDEKETEAQPSELTEKLLGTWLAEADITEALGGAAQIEDMAETWAELGIEDVSEYVSIRSSLIALTFELKADGKAQCTADEDSLAKAAEYYAEDITDSLIRAMEAGIANACEAEGILPDELYRLSGVEDIYELIPLLIEMPLSEYTQGISDETLSQLRKEVTAITGELDYTVESDGVELSFPGGLREKLVYSEKDGTLTGENFTLHK